MSTRRVKFYYCEMFQTNFWFMLGWSPKRAVKQLRNFADVPDDVIGGSGLGKTLDIETVGGNHIIAIWTSKPLSNPEIFATLAHECVHAANFCLGRVGVQPDFKNDETQAYLVGTLMRKAVGK